MKQQKSQDLLANAAKSLYDGQKEKENEEKKLRNSLLDDLGDKLTPAQILFSSIEDLKKMKDEMTQNEQKTEFKRNFSSATNSTEETKKHPGSRAATKKREKRKSPRRKRSRSYFRT